MSAPGDRDLMVLLVEDEEANRAFVQAVVAKVRVKLGTPVHILEATTVADARSALSEQGFDVVLLDVRLPDGSGLQIATELVERSGPKPWVVVMSASVHADQRQAAMSSGADAFIGKPFQPGELIDVFERIKMGRPAAGVLQSA